MIRRIPVCLVLVSALAAGTMFAADTAALPQQEQGPSWVMVGPQHGAYLGVYTRDVTAARVPALKLKEDTGVEITMVDQDAPAGKAGLRDHDVILTYNGERVEGEEELRRMVRETPPGRNVALGISRDGQPMTIHVTLGDRAQLAKIMIQKGMPFEEPAMAMPPVAPMPPMALDIPAFNVIINNADRSGLLVENLTPQLAEFFGAGGGASGILVRSVERGSPAAAAGFRAGDVITGLAKEKIADINDWVRIVRRHSGAVPVEILRSHRRQVLTLKLPVRTHSELLNPEEFRIQMEKLRPQMQMIAQQMQQNKAVIEEAQLAAQKELRAHQAEIDQARKEAMKEVQARQAEMRKAMELKNKELQKQMKELQKSLKEIRYNES